MNIWFERWELILSYELEIWKLYSFISETNVLPVHYHEKKNKSCSNRPMFQLQRIDWNSNIRVFGDTIRLSKFRMKITLIWTIRQYSANLRFIMRNMTLTSGYPIFLSGIKTVIWKGIKFLQRHVNSEITPKVFEFLIWS